MKKIKDFRKKYPWIFWSFVLTPIMDIFTFWLSSGSVSFLKFIYPYVFIFISFFQIPDQDRGLYIFAGWFIYYLYGFIITLAEKRRKTREAIALIILSHIIAFIFSILI